MAGINIWQLLIIAVIVVLLFGTNKLRSLGSDLGASIKGFKKAIGDEDQNKTDKTDKTENTTASKDADFEQKNIAEKKADSSEQSENKNKEQV
ncbi:Sec-independent protein translocase subunit TatA [Morganella psychrotolerans]|uniref:Sec-independent protein translocase protein TatA n=1 Tax=Morganella psychrotolerans TaxID=368603 RepID=A0A5M9QYU5_9GAMM|nr:Sec-independent protein translocase subunit TatA [Morganella psychrotolerans]KAA8712656.1 twin-arginine translocase TatA/TatE family subunit [Morganella psychrotolerans]